MMRLDGFGFLEENMKFGIRQVIIYHHCLLRDLMN